MPLCVEEFYFNNVITNAFPQKKTIIFIVYFFAIKEKIPTLFVTKY